MLTRGSGVFLATLDDAALVAGCLNGVKIAMYEPFDDASLYREFQVLKPEPKHPEYEEEDSVWDAYHAACGLWHDACIAWREPRIPEVYRGLSGRHVGEWWQWEDRQTGGGGVFIHWHKGVAWVSKHGGYGDNVDQTREASKLFRELGCKEASGWEGHEANPRSYGIRECEERMGAIKFYQHEGD
jgi:hypothetical protein